MLIFYACNSVDGRYEKLKEYLNDKHSYSLEEEIIGVVILDERGLCINCIDAFSDFIIREINNPKILFLICASGTRIDISEYLKFKTNKNVLFDRHNVFAKTELTIGSGVIFLSPQSVDTIVTISVENFSSNVDFIEKKIHERK